MARHLYAFLFFCGAAFLAVVSAYFSVSLIEQSSEIGVRAALDDREMGWAEVEANGLTVSLSGTAPTEADRFAAGSAAGTIVDTARIINDIDVTAVADLPAPRFSAEILRNDAGLTIAGLVPAATDHKTLVSEMTRVSDGGKVTELINIADFDAPEGWNEALAFAVAVIGDLPRAKVSVEAGHVSVTAITNSEDEKRALERQLNRTAPARLRLTLDIAAPRPVITPFTLRFAKGADGAQFDACSADTDTAAGEILTAARAAGVAQETTCIVGMGVPSPSWSRAVTQAIAAVDTLGAGTVTFSDADITLVALEGTDASLFDTVVGELEAALPPVFALYATLPESPDPDDDQGPPEFTATLSPEGLVQLRGRLGDETMRALVDSYAQAAFGVGDVYTATRIVPDLPADWSVRVLVAIEALARLKNGVVRVTPDDLDIRGNTGDETANLKITALLADKLGEAAPFTMDIVYQEALDPVAALPTPDECIANIETLQANAKISFEPGSATIDAGALDTMDDIAEVLKSCGPIRMEIQGHTDSQGREVMNQSLSQARAQSVLNELRARRVLTSSFSAVGYGEANPIADNGSEEGREANRRIAFVLIRPAPVAVDTETTLESTAQPLQSDATADDAGETREQN